MLLAAHSLSRWLTYFSATVPLSKKLLWPSDASSKFHKVSGDQSLSTARHYRQCTVCLPLTSTPALCACLSPFSSTYIALTGSRRITDIQHSVEGSQKGPAHHGRYDTYRCNVKFLAATVINYNTTLLNASHLSTIFHFWVVCIVLWMLKSSCYIYRFFRSAYGF